MNTYLTNSNWINSSPSLVCLLSSEWKILFVNNLFCNFFNISSNSILGKNFESFLSTIQNTNENILPEFSDIGNEVKFDFKYQSSSGVRWLEWKITPNNNNDEIRYIAFGWDIIEHKMMEKQLQRDQFFFNLLMDNITDQIYYKDKKSRFLKINSSFAIRHNFNSANEVIGKTDFDMFSIEHAQQAYDDEMEIIRTGNHLENIEEQETWMDGRITWVSTTKLPYKDSDGKIIGTFGISRDITTRKLAQESLKKSEEKLRELNIIKDKFFSIVAHDLRSPFNGLFGLVDILLTDLEKLSKDEINRTLTLLNNELKHVFQLLEDLLEWGRIQRNAIHYVPEINNICNSIKNIIDLYSINAKNKNITLRLDIPDEIKISYDVKMISTVIRNLLTNAIKFTYPGGNIIISAEDKINEIKVSVRDDGVGISRERAHKLFDLTEYFSTKGTAQESGTGLGLILCKEFVEKHHGKISVETEINKGSTFIFTIPKS
jgi:PAS domain S-box-containing protein